MDDNQTTNCYCSRLWNPSNSTIILPILYTTNGGVLKCLELFGIGYFQRLGYIQRGVGFCSSPCFSTNKLREVENVRIF